MSKAIATYDVFLFSTAHDYGVADSVRRVLEETGLKIFFSERVDFGSTDGDIVREALAESRALVAVLTPSALNSPLMMILAGAAMAWNQPVYILLDGVSPAEVPSYLKRFKVLPIAKLPHVVKAIVRSAAPLPEAKREILNSLYGKLGVEPDELAIQPAKLDGLTREFNKASDSTLSPEQVLQELVRLRKEGKLKRLQRRYNP